MGKIGPMEVLAIIGAGTALNFVMDAVNDEPVPDPADVVVEAGDTTWGIAKRCSTSPQAFTIIYDALGRDSTIYPGDEYDLPGGDGIICGD
jgi:hypothetical protein